MVLNQIGYIVDLCINNFRKDSFHRLITVRSRAHLAKTLVPLGTTCTSTGTGMYRYVRYPNLTVIVQCQHYAKSNRMTERYCEENSKERKLIVVTT